MIRLTHSTMLALARGEITPTAAFGSSRDIEAEWALELPAMLASQDQTVRDLAEAHCRTIEPRSDIKPCEKAARRRQLLATWARARGAA